MRAININIDEFLNVLKNLKSNKVEMIDLDIIQDENNPNLNRLIIHPVKGLEDIASEVHTSPVNKIEMRNPNFNPENDDIFNSFEDIL